MRSFVGLLLVVALLGSAASALDAQSKKEEATAGAEGFGDIFKSIVSAAQGIVQKAVIVAKTQVLVGALKAASPQIAQLGDEIIRKELDDKICTSAEGMVKATDKDLNKLANKGIDKAETGADKKAKPAFLELDARMLATLEDKGDFLKEAKRIVGVAAVKAAITDLANSMVDENADKIKIPKDKSVGDLTDKVTTAVVEMLQRGKENGANKASGNNATSLVGRIRTAATNAVNSVGNAASNVWNRLTGGGDNSAKARFRRVFTRQQVHAPLNFNLEISAKSYIRPVTSSGCWVICPDVFGYVIDPVCSAAAIAFCAAMGPMGVESNSEGYGSLGNARLYSKHSFTFTCENGKVTSVTPAAREGAVGKEGPLQGQPPSGDYDRIVARVDGGVGHIGYMFSGRPHGAAEPGFQALKFRTCTWIWHFPYYKINSCNENGWEGVYSFGGSNFPTRRLWQNSREIETIQQGRIDALWVPSSADRALVDGWFPFDFRY